jgi:hypothetical protein
MRLDSGCPTPSAGAPGVRTTAIIGCDHARAASQLRSSSGTSAPRQRVPARPLRRPRRRPGAERAQRGEPAIPLRVSAC